MSHFLIDTGVVIDRVQCRPCLWNTTHPDYKVKPARTQAWEEICEEMFEDLTQDEKDKLVKQIQQRWRTARDTYIKFKGTKRHSRSVKKYAFAEKLKFLERLGEEPVSSPSIINSTSAQDSNVQSTAASPRVSPWAFRKKRKKVLPRVQPMVHVHMDPVSNSEPELEHRATPQMLDLPDISSDDMAFFQSLGPIIRSFTMHQKLMFRSEVLNSAMSIVSIKHEHESPEC